MPLLQARLQEGLNDYPKVSVVCKPVSLNLQNFLTPKPEVPVGGRLAHFLPEWQSVTSDKWVLEVIQHGYALEFADMPPRFSGIRRTKMPCQKQHNILLQEVHTLLSKQAIELVPPQMAREGFYSTLFMVPKKNSEKLRPVINLKPLNQFLLKKSFKMDHLGVVMKLLREGDWALSIDLTDAYLHVPIRPNHRKFLRFAVGNHCYQFRCLPFGPTTAPRVFTKMLSAVMQFLREQGVQITAYLDDSLLFQNQPEYLCNSRDTTLQVLNRLGFLVNLVKSELVPSQSVKFIGAHFQLKRGIVSATQERFQKIKTLIQECSSRNQTSALMLLRILGVMASTIQVMRLGRLHMRPIQLYLMHFWSPKLRDIKALVPVNSVLQSHFQWWLQEENVLEGVPLQPVLPEVSITTDASLTGWGAVYLTKQSRAVGRNRNHSCT